MVTKVPVGTQAERAPIVACSPIPARETTEAAESIATSTPEFVTFTDKEGVSSISYPQDWPVVGPPFAPAYLAFVAPEGLVFLAGLPSEGGYNPNVSVVIDSSPEQLDVARYFAIAEKDASEELDGYRRIDQCMVLVGDRRALVVDADFNGDYGKSRSSQLIVADGDVMWIVTCSKVVRVSLGRLELCDAVLRSFRILR